MRRGEVWEVRADGGPTKVLVVSITEANRFAQAAVVVILHPADDYPDTVLTVVLKHPEAVSVFAMNLTQMRAGRFDPAQGARRLGSISDDDMARVESAVRQVLGV